MTALAHVSAAHGTIRYVVGSGWSRRVCVWREDDRHAPSSALEAAPEAVWASELAHADDVLCLAYHAPSTLVTATAGGELGLWGMDVNALGQNGGLQGVAHDDASTTATAASAKAAAACTSDDGGGAPSAMRLQRRLQLPSKRGVAIERVLLLPAIAPPLLPLLCACADGSIVVWGAV